MSSVGTSLVYGTVIVVLVIFAVFFVFAQRADKVVAERAAAKRAEMAKSGSKAKVEMVKSVSKAKNV